MSVEPMDASAERHPRRQVEDRGSYLLVLTLSRPADLDVGALGKLHFPPGHYVYVGSAMRALSARIRRHRRRHKACRWHVDYLRAAADAAAALPIRSDRRQECDLAAAVARVLDPGPAGFGCSDCRCTTHLFYSRVPPLGRRDLRAVVRRFGMPDPGPGPCLDRPV